MKFLRYLLVSFFLMLPCFASAGETIIKPPGKNTWEMHVMGNGPVIASVLESVKLIVAPDAGGSGFRTLLLFIALLGFCILAVQAGFNPGANLFKMFGYLFVVWVVTFTTTQLKANVIVIDPVTRTDTVVAKVPAIVALPAVVVSGIGHYLTQNIETAYSAPGQQLSLSGAGFDIFGKIQSDLEEYTVVQPELQKSMAAFVSDCAVSAIARQQLTPTELFTSNELMKTLEKARSKTTLTRYYEPAPDGATASSTFGIKSDVIDCDTAYGKIAVEMDKHAEQMKKASSDAWANSGVMVPFETVLQTFVEQANAGVGAGGGAYAKPTAMITQKALINTMGGDFRQAAIQSGNNELLTGLQISQAEQSQKSGWVTSAAIFKNMMGYVYTTLQAFIYAITPVVIIALMVPGLGKKIFVNYGQILVWLTLWEPMLSIVNYLVTLFRMEGMAHAVAGSGGINMLNTWTQSEAANNMVIAASFLGTMVPVLAWGLVTGAMAFNDFISHGIGSSFAMQAGAAAATGSVGLNSASMNKMESNKFDSAMKSTVGYQSVMAHETAGALTAASDHGGREESANGAKIAFQASQSQGNVASATTGKQVANSLNAQESAQAGHNAQHSKDTSTKASADQTTSRDHSEQSGTSASSGKSTGKDVSKSNSAKTGDTATVQEQHGVTMQVSSGAGMDVKGGGGGGAGGAAGAAAAAGKPKAGGSIKAGMNVNDAVATTNTAQNSKGVEASTGTSEKAGTSTSWQQSAAKNDSASTKGSVSKTTTNSQGSSVSDSAGKSSSLSSSSQVTDSTQNSKAHNVTDTLSVSMNVDSSADDTRNAAAALASAGQASLDHAQEAYANVYAADQRVQSVRSSVGSATSALDGAGAAAPISMPSVPGSGPDTSLLGKASSAVDTANTSLTTGAATMSSDVGKSMGTTLDNASSLLSGPSGLAHGPAGGSPFAVESGGADGKTALMGLGMAGTAVSALGGNAAARALVGRGAATAGAAVAGETVAGAAAAGEGAAVAGGLTAGGLMVGTAAVGGAAFAGYEFGTHVVNPMLNKYVGEENVAKFLEPVFKGIDAGVDAYQSIGSGFNAGRAQTPSWATSR